MIFDIPTSTPTILSNYFTRLRKQINGATISLGELETWCIKQKEVPESMVKPFVVDFEMKYGDYLNEDEENKNRKAFKIFISGKTLLQLLKKSNVLQADSISLIPHIN